MACVFKTHNKKVLVINILHLSLRIAVIIITKHQKKK